MAFVNLPPNFQDIFGSITDRIAKLETGPNQAMYTATSAQGTAQEAYVQALAANAAATQATYEAGIAIQSANGKTKTTYSTSAPGASPGNTGDLWFQVNGSGVVQYQYIYSGGVWNNAPISNTVIANLDAGKITAGTITGIAYDNGSGTFSVSSTGTLVATSATVQGTIRGESGYFAGALASATGTFGGFTIGATYLDGTNIRINSNTGIITCNGINSAAGITAQSGITLSTGGGALSMGTNNINNAGTIGGTSISASAALSAGTTVTSTSAATVTTSAATNCYITTGGIFTRTSNTSSQRYKDNITDISNVPALDPRALLDLPIRAFKYKADYLPTTDDRYDKLLPGFIAEEVNAVYPVAVDFENGEVETWNSQYIIPALLALIQDLNARVAALEGGA